MTKNNYRPILHTLVALIVLASLATFVVYQNTKKPRKPKVKENEVIFGIDMSGYQGTVINWDSVKNSHHPIKFFILRATRGDDRKDSAFLKNFIMAKTSGFVVGAYHYFDPNEDPRAQAKNYFQYASILTEGDFIPMVDIEKLPDSISLDSLKKNLKWMLDTVEQKFGTRPILYTGLKFYKYHLEDSIFSKYPLWISAFSISRRTDSCVLSAKIHQFSDSVIVEGIKGYVDGNDIRKTAFDSLLLKK